MAPAISLAYEMGEMDIMDRMPRNGKRDHLVTAKLISFSYLQVACIEFTGCMMTYFVVMNDYGIPFWTTLFMANDTGYFPNQYDVYGPAEPNYGNTNFGNHDYYNSLSF